MLSKRPKYLLGGQSCFDAVVPRKPPLTQFTALDTNCLAKILDELANSAPSVFIK